MKIIEEIYKICYFRWEFMRRDPEYQKDYNNFQWQINCPNADASHAYNMDKLAEHLFWKYEWDSKFLKITGPRFLPNYEKKFKELEDELDSYDIPILLFFSSDAVVINNKFEGFVRSPFIPRRDDELEITIDFSKVNTHERLIAWIEHIVQNKIKRLKENADIGKGCNVPKDPADWKRVIYAGDLRKENYSYSEIANKLIGKGHIDNEDPETAKQRVKAYCKRYNALTQGGWRELKYP